MCHISRKNVWRIIEKARVERQLKEQLSDLETEGGNFSSSLEENATSQDYSQDVSARTVSRFLHF